jgi:hypothetical protein
MRMKVMLAVTAIMLPFTTASHAPARAASCDSRSIVVEQGVQASQAQPETAVSIELSGTEARKGCGHGIRPCSANQVGQPCDPRNPGVICSAQANGTYCCLAYAP